MSVIAITFTPNAEEAASLRIAAEALGCTVEERQLPREPQAAFEYLLPGAVVLFAASAYFNGLLSELGKRHAPAVADAIKALYRHACRHAGRIVRAGDSANPFQGASTPTRPHIRPPVTIIVKAPQGKAMRFILPVGLSDQDMSDAIIQLPLAHNVAEVEIDSTSPVSGVPPLPSRAYVFLHDAGWVRLEVLIGKELKRG